MWKIIKTVYKKRLLYLKLSIKEKDTLDGLMYLLRPISYDKLRKLEPYYCSLVGFRLRHEKLGNSNVLHYYMGTLTLLDYVYKKQLRNNPRTPQYYKLRGIPYPGELLPRYIRMFKVEYLTLGISKEELYLDNYLRLDLDVYRKEFEEMLDLRVDDKLITDYLLENMNLVRENKLFVELNEVRCNDLYVYLKIKGGYDNNAKN